MLPATEALYYRAPALNFEAQVLAQRGEDVALSATAFYPEGGGQNADVGVLRWAGESRAVLDVQKDKASGVIWHRLGGQLPPVGAWVTGEVDAAARWRGMQRHSGEHLLAAAFFRLNPAFGVAAVSMRQPECTLDLAGQPTEKDLKAAETLLRETLGRQELRLRVTEVDEAELQRYPMRRGSKVRGRVRLVIFEDAGGQLFDVSACGGLHVPLASQALPVVILRSERIKGDFTRVTFMTGEEAGEYLSRMQAQARQLAASFSAGVEQLPERVLQLQAQTQSAKAQAEALRAELAALRLRAAPLEEVGGVPLRTLTLRDAAELPYALSACAAEVLAVTAAGGRCGVASGLEAYPADTLLRAALRETGGKGGGRHNAAQGISESPEDFVMALRRALLSG